MYVPTYPLNRVDNVFCISPISSKPAESSIYQYRPALLLYKKFGSSKSVAGRIKSSQYETISECDMEVLLQDVNKNENLTTGSLCKTLNGDLIIDSSTKESLQVIYYFFSG